MTADATRALFADIFFDDEEATDPSQVRLHHQIRAVETRASPSSSRRHDHLAPRRAVDGDAGDRLIHRLDLRAITAE